VSDKNGRQKGKTGGIVAKPHSKTMSERELSAFGDRLNQLFTHPRLGELKGREVEAHLLPRQSIGLVKALVIVDGQAVGAYGDDTPLDLESGRYRVETTTTNTVEDGVSTTETILSVWEKDAPT
jgi:hypothetical protein